MESLKFTIKNLSEENLNEIFHYINLLQELRGLESIEWSVEEEEVRTKYELVAIYKVFGSVYRMWKCTDNTTLVVHFSRDEDGYTIDISQGTIKVIGEDVRLTRNRNCCSISINDGTIKIEGVDVICSYERNNDIYNLIGVLLGSDIELWSNYDADDIVLTESE